MKIEKLNPVMDFINTLCNFIVLNLVFLITCLPAITIGAALSSLYYVMIREARGEYGYLVRTYLREFKRNLKNGTIAFGILALAGAILLFSLFFWLSWGTLLSAVLTGLLTLAAIVWFLTFSYTFPLIGRFDNTALASIRNAWILSFSNAKWTIALVLTDICTICFCLFFRPMKILMVLFGFAFLAYCQSFLFIKVFRPYEETAQNTSDDEDKTLLQNQTDMMSGTSQY